MQSYSAALALCKTDFAQRGLELYEFKLGPETAVGTVVERAERGAGKVVLHIAWIPVVGDIEDSYSHPASVLFPADCKLKSWIVPMICTA